MKFPIYLDNSATTPVDPRVLEAMLPYFKEKFGNASSRSHSFGWIAEEAVDYAREQVARLIQADPKEIIFTSGATESNNLALKGVFEMYQSKGNHIITVVTEHKCVLEAARHLERQGAEITYLPVNSKGEIDLSQLEDAIRPTTVLISVMYANNEIGVIHPIREISAIAERHGVLLHTDATQAAGKVPIDVKKEGIHLLSMSAHKMYGPKGVGCLYVRRRNPRVKVTAQMDGGGHERGMRSGTLNVPGIVGFGAACEICGREMKQEAERLSYLRNKLENALLQIEEVALNGSTENRLPHLTNLSFKWVEGEGLMMAFNKDIAVSSGSACTSASLEPSYVLKALGLGDELAHSSIRFSLGRFNTEEEIDYTIERVTDAVQRLREMSPLWEMYKEGIDLKTVEFRPH
ncbi:MAG: IscS subfamily cysteine desulfurase [Chitinophagales bacterium]|nr:IscS subfamily cysteine desulfurase [Chitinophagales bacterium]